MWSLVFTHQFNGDSAFVYIQKQCDFGPRYPGSDAHKIFSEFLYTFFNKYSESIQEYNDTIIHPISNKKIEISNFLIKHNINADERYLFMAHWDTRDRADKDINSDNHNVPILGANDGASGVALLMELSKYISNNPLSNIGVDILLVDAEDMGRSGHVNEWGLGTQSFVKQYEGKLPKFVLI